MAGERQAARSAVTTFGFRWGPMTVERLTHVEGRGYCLEVRTGHKRMQVYVSEAGRKIEAMEVRDGR